MYAAGIFICVQYDEDKAQVKDVLKQEKVEFWDIYYLFLLLLCWQFEP